jgi:hypothetical protein
MPTPSNRNAHRARALLPITHGSRILGREGAVWRPQRAATARPAHRRVAERRMRYLTEDLAAGHPALQDVNYQIKVRKSESEA